MTMVCDRCGEAFPLSNDVKYMTPFDDKLDRFESNYIVKCLAGDDKGIYSIRDETVVLCPSCMAKLNDWLKGEQKRQWIDVRDKLPEEYKSVLGVANCVDVRIVHYALGGFWMEDTTGEEYNITYWMPLPKIPKEN